jgi:GNAT superfamily N-acetyltransferase
MMLARGRDGGWMAMLDDDRPRGSRAVAVRVLGPDDAQAAAAVLADGFDQEPALRTLLPDAAARRKMLELTLRVRLHDPLRRGTVHGAWIGGELGAVAVWYAPGAPMLSGFGALRALLTLPSVVTSLAGAFAPAVRLLASDVRGAGRLFRTRRPAVRQAVRGLTWRLDLLATVPARRGMGLARALLDRQLQRCDEDGAAAWLEATDPVNPPIYERFGFETLAHDDGPSWMLGYWVMRREPRPGRPSDDRA